MLFAHLYVEQLLLKCPVPMGVILHGWSVRAQHKVCAWGRSRGDFTLLCLCLGKCDLAFGLHHPYRAHTPAATKNYRSRGLMFFLSEVLLPPSPHWAALLGLPLCFPLNLPCFVTRLKLICDYF